ncbi:TatD family hydrolase [Runella sp. MFBS21]|uniref:TatD family hydrolase n=1 Tax=Runella sp. MFBS21 TaxID=3034018 RepID=UPI0023F733CC|nr:TatD family hydrolase [Runella sp. MFBS21]MDF7817903.1 TatD family hydrolase [Runella sp. MFBS21]
MIETHAHIYDDAFDEDRTQMLERAFESGITQIWMPNCDHTTIDGMMALATQYPNVCRPMIGLHPTYVKADFEQELYIVENWLHKMTTSTNHPISIDAISTDGSSVPQFVAIGEIGMDLYWDKTFVEQQKQAFLIQCDLAIKHHLWIDIHCRNAFWEVVELIEKVGNSRLTGIFHCFTGTLEEAQKAIDLGFKLGIGGVATFKNGGLDKVLPYIDMKHIVLETDSPYLAPVPYRGKRNEVAYVPLIAQRVADLMQVSVEVLASQTTANALSLLSYT